MKNNIFLWLSTFKYRKCKKSTKEYHQSSKRNETYWCPEKYAYEDQKKKLEESWFQLGVVK